MTSIFKEYGFVIVSMIGAVVFFFLLGYMLRYQNKASLVRMMDSNAQYSKNIDLNSYEDYGHLDTMASVAMAESIAPHITIDDSSKSYKLEYEKTKRIEGLDGNITRIEPDYWVLTTDNLLSNVSVTNAPIFNIQMIVTDYTLALKQSDSATETSIWGRMEDPETVIAVDKFGNKKVNADGTYEMTERTAYQQRNSVDSTTLGADEYTGSYGQVYFYQPSVKGRQYRGWYKDTDGDGVFNPDVDTNVTYDYRNYSNLGSSARPGIVFSTTIPHRFKVLYRILGQRNATSNASDLEMTFESNGNVLKDEVTKLFIAPTRSQAERSTEVWNEVYGEGETEVEITEEETEPIQVLMVASAVSDYDGVTASQLIDEAVANKLAAVQEWQEEEREKAEEEASLERERKEKEEQEKAEQEKAEQEKAEQEKQEKESSNSESDESSESSDSSETNETDTTTTDEGVEIIELN